MLKNSQFFVFVCEGSRQSKIIVLIAVSYTLYEQFQKNLFVSRRRSRCRHLETDERKEAGNSISLRPRKSRLPGVGAFLRTSTLRLSSAACRLQLN